MNESNIDETKGVRLMRHPNKLRLQRRRPRLFFWLFAAAAVCVLLFQEQVAALYVLSTLAVCGLLIVVAFSNLESRDAEMQAAAVSEAADEVSTNSRLSSRKWRRAA